MSAKYVLDSCALLTHVYDELCAAIETPHLPKPR